MSKEDFIRQFILGMARDGDTLIKMPVTEVLTWVKNLADHLYPVDPVGKHKAICKVIRNADFKLLIKGDMEESYEHLSEVMDSELTESELKLFSHLYGKN